MTTLPIQTAEGTFWATYSDAGLKSLDFPGKRRTASKTADAQVSRWHELTTTAINAVLAGRSATKLPPLDLAGHTSFRRTVWEQLRGIKTGATLSYGDIAERIGKSKAARAVGSACGANPLPLLIPCHRVLASGGTLGGFSGGLDWKKRLLAREGIQF